MKFVPISLLVLSASGINARFVEQNENQAVIVPITEPKRLIEFPAGEQQWVTETEAWAIRSVPIPKNLSVPECI